MSKRPVFVYPKDRRSASLPGSESREPRSFFLLFSLILACALLLSLHIHVENPTWGGAGENSFTAWSWRDLVLFPLLCCGVYLFTARLLFPLSRRAGLALQTAPAAPKRFALLFALILLCWLPWLIRYYPGFVFRDTEDSLSQALGAAPLNNRNPVLFTLFFRLCLRLGGAFSSGDLTRGCAVFSMFQMLFLAAAFAYASCWVTARFGLKSRWWLAALLLYYGANPYFASSALAMWKDPVFSGAVLLLSLQLMDAVLTAGASCESLQSRLLLFLNALLCAFWRNNGFCALIGALAGLLLLPGRKLRGRRALLLIFFGALALWAAVFTVGFRLAHIGTPKEESAGLMLNQLARAAACGGALSEEDAACLGVLFPLDAYAEAYTPCCVDPLKWDGRFRYEALAGSRLFKTWASVGLKNPRLYLEGWALETYGFWSFTRPEALTAVQTISDVGALYEDGLRRIGDASLHARHTQDAAPLLPVDTWSVPAGLLLWLMLLGCAINASAGQRELNLVCAPCLGVMLGLILGTPIWYLPRYGACAQMLLPVLLLLPLSRTPTQSRSSCSCASDSESIQEFD